MIEGFEDIGNYLSMITDVIGQYVQTFDTEFPAEFDNTNQDYISKCLYNACAISLSYFRV